MAYNELVFSAYFHELNLYIKGLYNRTHHIHIFHTGDPEIERHLDFLNYMIAHPKEAKEYGELKNKLAIKFRYDAGGYCAGKNEFIKTLMKKLRNG